MTSSAAATTEDVAALTQRRYITGVRQDKRAEGLQRFHQGPSLRD